MLASMMLAMEMLSLMVSSSYLGQYPTVIVDGKIIVQSLIIEDEIYEMQMEGLKWRR